MDETSIPLSLNLFEYLAEQLRAAVSLFGGKGQERRVLRKLQCRAYDSEIFAHRGLRELISLVGYDNKGAAGAFEPAGHGHVVSCGLVPRVHDVDAEAYLLRLGKKLSMSLPQRSRSAFATAA